MGRRLFRDVNTTMSILVALAVAAVAGGMALLFAAWPSGGGGTLLTSVAKAALFLAAVYATANAAACWAAGY